mmetsp:Transcript_4283/g.5276  ORF Transcript_4283/g.5276 Transcript_4283/m.5276 type:complete len:125 (+) Transcript_4283:965-1339(+)
MGNSKGKRRKTRQLLKQRIPVINNYQNNFLMKYLKNNDKVNIVLSPSTKKGIPSKSYFGKTGIFLTNLNKVSCVLIKKQTENRVINKKLFLNKKHFDIEKKMDNSYSSERMLMSDHFILRSSCI